MPRTTYHVFNANGQDEYDRDIWLHEATVEDAPSARKAIEAVKGADEALESYSAVPVRNWTGFKVGKEMRMVFESLPDKQGARVISLASAPEEEDEPEPEPTKEEIRKKAAASIPEDAEAVIEDEDGNIVGFVAGDEPDDDDVPF